MNPPVYSLAAKLENGQSRAKKTDKETTTTRALAKAVPQSAWKAAVAVSSGRPSEKEMDALCEKIERLANEFGLNQSQVTQVFKHAHSDGLAYIEEKAAVVRSQPRENAGRAFRAALKGDWKLPKASAPKAKRSARKPEPEGWREALRAIADERYPNADPDAWPDWKALPGDLKAEVGEYLGRQRGA